MKKILLTVLVIFLIGCEKKDDISAQEELVENTSETQEYIVYYINEIDLKDYEGAYRASVILNESKSQDFGSVDLSEIDFEITYENEDDSKKLVYNGNFTDNLSLDSYTSYSFSGTIFIDGDMDNNINILDSDDADKVISLDLYFTNKGVIFYFRKADFELGTYRCEILLERIN